MGEVTGAAPALPYAARVRSLTSCGIALWDVLESCEREGSLDSAIDDATIHANDFASFYRAHRRIAQVFFNGAKAESCYRKYVPPWLEHREISPSYRRLPSTSPAHASMSLEEKQTQWRRALELALGSRPAR
jgi:hypoxanthine-DNA glycosylase